MKQLLRLKEYILSLLTLIIASIFISFSLNQFSRNDIPEEGSLDEILLKDF